MQIYEKHIAIYISTVYYFIYKKPIISCRKYLLDVFWDIKTKNDFSKCRLPFFLEAMREAFFLFKIQKPSHDGLGSLKTLQSNTMKKLIQR